PWAVLFVVLLALTFVGTAAGLATGCWRVLRGPARVRALAWTLAAALPLACWAATGIYGWQQWGSLHVPNNFAFVIVKESAAALMEFQARFFYRHRLEGERLVMFY